MLSFINSRYNNQPLQKKHCKGISKHFKVLTIKNYSQANNHGTIIITMGVLTIKKSNHKPVRYEIKLDRKIVFTISLSTLRQYTAADIIKDVRKGREPHINLPLSDVVKTEQNFLLQEAYAYLSKGERSPYQLQLWCTKRAIPEEWTDTIINRCYEKDFLNPERFTAAFVKIRSMQAHKPWTQVAYELTCHKIPATLIEKYAYSDLEILKKTYIPHSPKKKVATLIEDLITQSTTAAKPQAHTDLHHYLSRQGFSYQTIKALITHLRSEYCDPP
ncbi:hypothetical protein COTS27_00047 [Spirochaetota bacterium]|nr:hypothetical protein COTS27_00047 [Spirochaetota bacterium]